MDRGDSFHVTTRSRYRKAEIVVGLQYLKLVDAVLRRWSAAPTEVDKNRRLGLALVRISPAEGVRGLHLRDNDLYDRAFQSASDDAGPSGQPPDIDVLLRGLRLYFAGRYAGWSPTLGKNRILGSGNERDGEAVGQYQIVGGDEGLAVSAQYQIVGGGARGASWRRNVFGSTRTKIGPRGMKPGSGVRVAVIDTKLAWHPWFAGGVEGHADDIWTNSDDIPASPAAQHASFVAGLILNEAPGALVHLRSGLNDEAHADSWDVARKIARLSDEGVDVLNLSLGCSTDDGQPPLVLAAALNALGPETLVVAAAGNHGNLGGSSAFAPAYPAALERVVAVGALDQNNERASFSPDTPWIDALAPGVKVLSTYTDRQGPRFATWSGTSFSAATVSGAIAAAMRPDESSTRAWRRLARRSNRLGGVPMIATPPRRWPTAP